MEDLYSLFKISCPHFSSFPLPFLFLPPTSPPASDSDLTTFPQGRGYQETVFALFESW